MAHFVRPYALADSLDPGEYEVFFYTPARYTGYLANKPFTVQELATMPGEQMLANMARGAPMFSAEVLRNYVREDREVIRSVRPDLVIGDLRLSLPVSARLERARFAMIMNAYWSPWARKYAILPEIPLTRIVSPRLLGPVYRGTEKLTYAVHIGPINEVRREHGIPALPPDLRRMYTDADFVLYPDIPEFIPTTGLPASHRYVGICEWASTTAKPEWWEKMLADPKPKVFVSLGSSGPVKVLPALLRALAALPVSVVLSTSGRQLPQGASATWVAPLLPFTETASVSSVVVSHGGSGGLYPAMAAGTPVLGIPSNADQHLSTAFLEANGAGLGVRVEEASERRLRAALEKLLFEPQYRERAREWAGVYARYDSSTLFREFLRDALAKPADGATAGNGRGPVSQPDPRSDKSPAEAGYRN